MISTERDAPSSVRARHAAARVAPERGSWQARIQRAAGERPPRARPQRRGSPGPIPNPAVKPAFAESTAAQGCGRAGRRARGGRFSIARGRPRRPGEARGGIALRASPRYGEVAASRAAQSELRAADLAGVRCVRGVRAERMDGLLCLCRWYDNSPGFELHPSSWTGQIESS